MFCLTIFLYRYLYELDEHPGEQRRLATNFIWSKNTCRLEQVIEESGNCVLLFLQSILGRDFMHEKLTHIPKDTQVLPERVCGSNQA